MLKYYDYSAPGLAQHGVYRVEKAVMGRALSTSPGPTGRWTSRQGSTTISPPYILPSDFHQTAYVQTAVLLTRFSGKSFPLPGSVFSARFLAIFYSIINSSVAFPFTPVSSDRIGSHLFCSARLSLNGNLIISAVADLFPTRFLLVCLAILA